MPSCYYCRFFVMEGHGGFCVARRHNVGTFAPKCDKYELHRGPENVRK